MRKVSLAIIALLVVCSFAAKPHSASAQVADLKQTLEKGLKARRPAEFAFIAKVVNLVNQKKLTLRLVLSTFKWARNKRPHPYPYFQRAMRTQAAKLGVTI